MTHLELFHLHEITMTEAPAPQPPPPVSRTYETHAPRSPTVTGSRHPNQTNATATGDTQCLYQLLLLQQDIGNILFVLFVPVVSIIGIVGLINNTLSFVVLRKFVKSSTPIFMMQVLAIADNMVLLSMFFYFTLPYTYEYTGSLVGYYEFFQHAKGYIWFILWFSKTLSIYTLVLMTVDRYIALCHPLKAHRLCNKKKAIIGVIFVIAFSIVYNMPKLWYVQTLYKYDPCTDSMRPSSTLSPTYHDIYFKHIYMYGAYFVVMYLVPLHVLLVLNIFLIAAVRKARKMRQTISGATSGGNTKDSVTERIIGVVSAFILLESPSIVANVLININQLAGGKAMDIAALHWGARIGYILSAVNSFINFYIYVLVGKRFRRYLVHIFRKGHSTPQDSNASQPGRTCFSDVHRASSVGQASRMYLTTDNNGVVTSLLHRARNEDADKTSKTSPHTRYMGQNEDISNSRC